MKKNKLKEERCEEQFELNSRQKMFCDEYLLNGNSAQAAEKAGYNNKRMNDQGYKLLQNPAIKKYIESHQKQIEIEYGITKDWKLKKLKRCVEFGIPDHGDLDPKYVRDAIKAISELNKMQGDHAPVKTINFIDANKEVLMDLVKQYERPY